MPSLSKKGYETEPEYADLCRMDLTQLENVQNFTVKNKFAKVVFLDKTNVVGLDLDKIIQLNHKSVELYNDERSKPNTGEGLNKPALITFYEFELPSKMSEEKFYKKVKNWTREMNADFVEFNPKDKMMTIHVEHF